MKQLVAVLRQYIGSAGGAMTTPVTTVFRKYWKLLHTPLHIGVLVSLDKWTLPQVIAPQGEMVRREGLEPTTR
jgi:hypothetical protein